MDWKNESFLIETENSTEVGEKGSCLMSTEFQISKMKKLWRSVSQSGKYT